LRDLIDFSLVDLIDVPKTRTLDCHSEFWDGLVPITSADLNFAKVTTQHVRTLTTSRFHVGEEGNDFPAILCALDQNCAEYDGHSPVDIEVIAPSGRKMAKDFVSIPGASYMTIPENAGHEGAIVLIPFPEGGQYTVKATPKPGAQPTDTFTITMIQNGVTTKIADHMMIQNIPAAGFQTHVNSRPFANAGPDQLIECSGPSGTAVTLNGSASGDQDGDPLAYVWTDSQGKFVGKTARVNLILPLGTQTYTLTLTDPWGYSATAQTHVTVRDTKPPKLTVLLSPNVLWPPNNTLVPITATLQTADVCDASPRVSLVSITSNEPDSGLGDIQGAVFGTDDRSYLLRAQRLGNGIGRVYTVNYRATDQSGNSTTSSAQVSVPHDQGNR